MNHYAFIDSQNLNLSIQTLGWKLDFIRFRRFLSDKYKIKKAFLFLGYIEKNKSLYSMLEKAGYILVFKPTVEMKGKTKGNCDAELVLHTMIEYNCFDKAMIISGDGDFYCLIEYLQKKNKLLKVGIPNKRQYSSLLKKFIPSFLYISDFKRKLEHKKSEYPIRH